MSLLSCSPRAVIYGTSPPAIITYHTPIWYRYHMLLLRYYLLLPHRTQLHKWDYLLQTHLQCSSPTIEKAKLVRRKGGRPTRLPGPSHLFVGLGWHWPYIETAVLPSRYELHTPGKTQVPQLTCKKGWCSRMSTWFLSGCTLRELIQLACAAINTTISQTISW